MSSKNQAQAKLAKQFNPLPTYEELVVAKCFKDNGGNLQKTQKCYEDRATFILRTSFFEGLSEYCRHGPTELAVCKRQGTWASNALLSDFSKYIIELNAYRR